MKILSLSHKIDKNTPLYGGQKRVKFSSEKSIKNGDSSNVLKIAINTHTSTHIDAPYHFIKNGKMLTDYEPESWIFNDVSVRNLSITPDSVIDEGCFKDLETNRSTDLLIIKTEFENFRGKRAYTHESPVVLSRLAGFIKKKLPNLRAIGFDFISISSLKNREEGRKTHKEFLKKNILIVEDMKLSELKGKPDSVLISPLLIDKADASPVSVWAFYNKFDLNRYDYFFFDFDGVILDSLRIKIDGFVTIYRKFGKDIADEVLKREIASAGMSRFDKFRLYHQELLGIKLTDRQVEEFADQYSSIVEAKVLRAKYIDGVRKFLKICAKKKNKTCFIVSAAAEPEVKRIVKLKGLKPYFSDVKGSPQVKGKNVRDLIKTHKVNRKRAVFFGDSLNDQKAADLNNMPFVGINTDNAAIFYPDFKKLLKEGGLW